LLEIPFDREVARIYAEGGLPAAVDDSYREMFNRLLTQIVQPSII